jgi:hypothetical protein
MERRLGTRVNEVTEAVTRVDAEGDGYRVSVGEVDYRVSDGVIEVAAVRGVELSRPWVKLKLPARVGDSWTADESLLRKARPGRTETPTVIPSRTFVVGPEEEVAVPAGRFQAVPIVSEEGHYRVTEWYALGVGLIKFEGTTNGAVQELTVLKSFTPGD